MGFKKDHPLADPKDNVFLKAGRDAHQEYFMITVQKVLCKAMLPFCLAVNARTGCVVPCRPRVRVGSLVVAGAETGLAAP